MFEDLAPTLNPTMHARLEAEIREAEAEARRHAETFLATEASNVDARRQQLLVDACEVRDAYESLTAEVARGDARARDAAAALAELNRRRQAIERALDDTQHRIDELAAVEDDPLAWVDRRYDAAPLTRPTFSF